MANTLILEEPDLKELHTESELYPASLLAKEIVSHQGLFIDNSDPNKSNGLFILQRKLSKILDDHSNEPVLVEQALVDFLSEYTAEQENVSFLIGSVKTGFHGGLLEEILITKLFGQNPTAELIPQIISYYILHRTNIYETNNRRDLINTGKGATYILNPILQNMFSKYCQQLLTNMNSHPAKNATQVLLLCNSFNSLYSQMFKIHPEILKKETESFFYGSVSILFADVFFKRIYENLNFVPANPLLDVYNMIDYELVDPKTGTTSCVVQIKSTKQKISQNTHQRRPILSSNLSTELQPELTIKKIILEGIDGTELQTVCIKFTPSLNSEGILTGIKFSRLEKDEDKYSFIHDQEIQEYLDIIINEIVSEAVGGDSTLQDVILKFSDDAKLYSFIQKSKTLRLLTSFMRDELVNFVLKALSASEFLNSEPTNNGKTFFPEMLYVQTSLVGDSISDIITRKIEDYVRKAIVLIQEIGLKK